MPVAGPLAEYMHGLQAARGRAYDVDIAELARRAGVDATWLAAALSGEAVLPRDATLAFVRACGAETDGWNDRWQAAAAASDTHGTGGTPPPPAAPGRRPERPAVPPTTVVRPVDAPGTRAFASSRPEHTPATEPRGWSGEPDRNARRPLEPGDPRSIGGYVLRARLGAGGMGRVYLSATPGGRPVALKVVRPEFAEDPEFRRRFRQEVAAAQQVHGMYTAPVIDAGPHAPQPWLATAYVPGLNLHEAVVRHGPLPAATVVLLVAGVAEALQSVHAAGIVHRDLKPSNVILAADGPRVIDFGIARAADASSVTQAGMSIGTPAYMAPEQIDGAPVTFAADVFALGSLAVYAATGVLAFGDSGGPTAVLHRIVNSDPDLSACPEPVRRIAARMLAKDPADRPTAAQVVDLCREASGDSRLQVATGWLPATVVEDGADRERRSLPALPPDPVAAERRARFRLVALVAVLVLVAAAGVAYGLANRGGGGEPPPNASATGVTTPATPPAAPGSGPGGVPGPGATTPATTGTGRPGTGGPPSHPDAGGPTPGQELRSVEMTVPVAHYCISLERDKPFPAGISFGCEGVAGTTLLLGDILGVVQGYEFTIVPAGRTANYASCDADTAWQISVRGSELKPGSMLCMQSREAKLIGLVQVLEAATGEGTFWKVRMTTWQWI